MINPKVHIVYAHPSKKSITHEIKEWYIQGLTENGIEYTLIDLYESNFNSDITEDEYLRENNNIYSPLSKWDNTWTRKNQQCRHINIYIPIILDGCTGKISWVLHKSIH